MELSSDQKQAIQTLCAQGYELYDQQHFEQALREFYQAWLKLPKPQAQYPEAGWTLAAIGDTYYKLGNYAQAIEALNSSLFCPQGERAFTHVRLGQCYYEIDDKTPAAQHFTNAEELDPVQLKKLSPKYRLFIKNYRLRR